MALNDADRALEAIEEQAVANHRRSEEIERVVSISSVSTSSSSSLDASSYRRTSGAVAGSGGLGLGPELDRIETQRDLDRHQTELSRIQTARSQHSGTVGRDVKSRDRNRPLPGFGAGKPYPPLLPNQDDYVVEFDGPDDPLHAQNWAFKKK